MLSCVNLSSNLENRFLESADVADSLLNGKELVQTVVLSFKLAHVCVSSNLVSVFEFVV